MIARDVSRIAALRTRRVQATAWARSGCTFNSYRTPEGAAAARQRLVQNDGYAVIQWVGEPHAFQWGSVVALYLGRDPGSVDLLRRTCGADIRP